MNPVLDHLLVCAAVGCAIGFFLVRAFRKRKQGGCGADCGCSLQRRGKK